MTPSRHSKAGTQPHSPLNTTLRFGVSERRGVCLQMGSVSAVQAVEMQTWGCYALRVLLAPGGLRAALAGSWHPGGTELLRAHPCELQDLAESWLS